MAGRTSPRCCAPSTGSATADGVPAIPRLRFVTSHPWDLTDRLIAAMAECPSVCEHLHLPVQSGDDAVLRRMGRQYTVDAYLALVERLRAAVPGIALTTDVIVGFCGETEAQFENTLDAAARRSASRRCSRPRSRPAGHARRAPDRRRAARREEAPAPRPARPAGGDRPARQRGVGRAHDRGARRPGPPDQSSTRRRAAAATRRRPQPQNKLVHFDGGPELVGRLVNVHVEHAGPYALIGRARRLSQRAPAAHRHRGATATGKTRPVARPRRAIPGAEIISADSRQVYRGMDIGTAKVSAADQARVPHHGLDLVESRRAFTAADFRRSAFEALAGIAARGGVALLVGGTGCTCAPSRGACRGETGHDPAVRAELEERLASGGAARPGGGADGRRAHRCCKNGPRQSAPRGARPGACIRRRAIGRRQRRAAIRRDRCGSALPDRRRTRDGSPPAPRAQFEAGLIDEARGLRERYDPVAARLLAAGYHEAFAVLDGRGSLEYAIERNSRAIGISRVVSGRGSGPSRASVGWTLRRGRSWKTRSRSLFAERDPARIVQASHQAPSAKTLRDRNDELVVACISGRNSVSQ